MKKILALVGAITFQPPINIRETANTIVLDSTQDASFASSYEELVNALIRVESSGDPSAYNATTDAVGCLQILPIMVREVNRILKLNEDSRPNFTLEDRWDCDKSMEMFDIWADYHHCYNSYEHIARNWNGGPTGFRKNATKEYWNRVKKYLTLNK
jgi:hypothetical protein